MAKKATHIINPEKIHLIQIEPISSVIAEVEVSIQDDETIDFKIAHISAHHLEDKRFLMGLEIILILDGREQKSKAKFRYDFHFAIDNLKDMYKLDENNDPIFQKVFGATLAGISYSTLRGIIFEKLSNSSWGSITLPVIDPNQILDTWIEVDN
jgi:hypothetical protein